MKKLGTITLLACLTLMFTHCSNKNAPIQYPEAAMGSNTDVYFGVKVADPYRWLENDTAPEVEEWVKQQNEITQNYLQKIPFREDLNKRLTAISNYEKIGAPFKKHGKYYFYRNDGLQNQSVLYVKETLDGEAEVLLDPNTLSDDGTVALNGISFSHDGKYLAYTISRSGSDWVEIYVMDLATRQLTDDHIEWAKFTSAAWHGDGFYYSCYDRPEAGKEYSNMNENHKIFYHKMGTAQEEDVLIYENPKYPQRFYVASTDEDETVMFISEDGFGAGNNLMMKDLRRPNAPVVALTTDADFIYSPIEVMGNNIYIYTNYKAPKYRLMKANIDNPRIESWTEVIPEGENVLSSAEIIDGKFVLCYNQDCSEHAYIYTLEGQKMHEVELPTLGTVWFSGDKDEKEVFYGFSSFTFPATIYKYDIDNNKSELYMAPKVDFKSDDYLTEQIFFTSKDGTKVPMFITYKRGLNLRGNNPVLLYGYGGFNISLNPSFSTMRIPFLENGGIYAQVNLRGGSEYGEEWHQAGTKMNKQNVFDDFIAAAEYLISENYTNPQKVAIMGGSNGGLLIGACVNQRPDLYRVAIPQVGVMDMLRYHLFTIGWNWAPDYGTSADSKEMFEYLYKYSPLHNIKNDGTPYPAILVTTADHDDRVVPAHSFKYTAALQAANTGNAPKLIRIETKAGHGGGMPLSKVIEEYTDIYAFIMYNLGMKPKFQ